MLMKLINALLNLLRIKRPAPPSSPQKSNPSHHCVSDRPHGMVALSHECEDDLLLAAGATSQGQALHPQQEAKNPLTLQRPEQHCPKCGSLLIEREGAYGKFLGCMTYPECNYRKGMSRSRTKSYIAMNRPYSKYRRGPKL